MLSDKDYVKYTECINKSTSAINCSPLTAEFASSISFYLSTSHTRKIFKKALAVFIHLHSLKKEMCPAYETCKYIYIFIALFHIFKASGKKYLKN